MIVHAIIINLVIVLETDNSLNIINACYDRIDVSESFGINNTSTSKECITCCYFLDKGFRFSNGCHCVLRMS